MKRLFAYVAFGLLTLAVIAALGVIAVAEARWDRTFDAPLPAIHASTDSATVERGRYLAYGPAMCVVCHAADDQQQAVNEGAEPPLVGGHVWELPFGVVRSRNITPDSATGIGRYTDAQLARVLRHGVAPDGRAVLPFMPYQHMSDEDLQAILSFLRAQTPVHNVVAPTEPNLLGRALLAMLITPSGPTEEVPVASPQGVTVERGRYLANSVADCVGCHSPRNTMDGSFTGPRFSGGMPFTSLTDPGVEYVTPNLTPDPETGIMAAWSEEQFVARFRAGPLLEGTAMPWRVLGRMTDDDLRAIYRYLRSLKPVVNDVGPVVRGK